MSTHARFWSVAVGTATLAVACNQMLGIEDANVDARLGTLGQGAASAAGVAAAGTTGIGGSTGAADGGSAGTSAAGHDHHSTSGAGGSEAGSAGSEESPEPSKGGTGGTSVQSAGGTHSGSGSAGKGSNEHAGAAGDDSGPSADPCDDYCDAMQSECTGDAEQYHDRAQCMTICHLFPPGADDSDANSVACRLKYVKKTQYGLGAEVTNYCRQAGPSGDGKCGTSCQAFCSVMMEVCTAESAGQNHFASTADCLDTCNALPAATVHYSDMDPAVSDGNHALCRLFHVNSAAMADALEHCEHAMGITLCQANP